MDLVAVMVLMAEAEPVDSNNITIKCAVIQKMKMENIRKIIDR